MTSEQDWRLNYPTNCHSKRITTLLQMRHTINWASKLLFVFGLGLQTHRVWHTEYILCLRQGHTEAAFSHFFCTGCIKLLFWGICRGLQLLWQCLLLQQLLLLEKPESQTQRKTLCVFHVLVSANLKEEWQVALRDIGDLLGSGRRADGYDAGGSKPVHRLL